MTIGIIDYASSYFKYKMPMPIRRELIHKSLKRLKLELQSNASSVETDLGGGNYADFKRREGKKVNCSCKSG